MRARTHFIRIQRTLYERLKDYITEFLGGLSPELKKYFKEYQRDFRDFKEVSSKRELLFALRNAHIVVCGDYHTLSQAQRTVIRLLREAIGSLKRRKRNLILALEMVHYRDGAKVAAYLAGELTENEFLESISFHKNWGFNWENYRKIFQFARENSIEIVGINYSKKKGFPTLRERDRFAAGVIADLTKKDDKAMVFVLVGDLHLAENHLPRQIDLQLRKHKVRRNRLIILQNDERFYWKLVERGLEQLVDVVKVRDHVFCVMNATPWVKLKSHLKWAELLSEADSAPPLLEKGKGAGASRTHYFAMLEGSDFTHEIREIIAVIRAFLSLPEINEDDFEIHHPGDLGFINRLGKDRRFSKADLRFTARCLTEFDSHFISLKNIIFLSTLSSNQAAAQAAYYLHAKVSGGRRGFRDIAEDFYPAVWIEALGFFGSKIINHKRKCNGRKDLERFLEQAEVTKKKRARVLANLKVVRLALEHLEIEKSGSLDTFKLPARTVSENQALLYFKVTKVLGQLLGQAIYSATMENQIERADVRRLFENPFIDSRKARSLYLRWIKKLDAKSYRELTKTELL